MSENLVLELSKIENLNLLLPGFNKWVLLLLEILIYPVPAYAALAMSKPGWQLNSLLVIMGLFLVLQLVILTSYSSMSREIFYTYRQDQRAALRYYHSCWTQLHAGTATIYCSFMMIGGAAAFAYRAKYLILSSVILLVGISLFLLLFFAKSRIAHMITEPPKKHPWYRRFGLLFGVLLGVSPVILAFLRMGRFMDPSGSMVQAWGITLVLFMSILGLYIGFFGGTRLYIAYAQHLMWNRTKHLLNSHPST